MKKKVKFYKYKKITTFILSMLVIFLFSYSIYGTAEYLGLFDEKTIEDNTEEENKSITSSLEKKKNTELLGSTSGNLAQHYSGSNTYGMMVFDDKYLYKSEKISDKIFTIKKYLFSDLVNGKTEGEQILTGYEIHSLFLIDSNLYFISTSQNEELEKCEVIAKISTNGDDYYEFKYSQSSKITSMVTDGEYFYYSQEESNDIYALSIDGNIRITLLDEESSKGTPYIFGFLDNNIYYVNGYEMATLNVQTGIKTVISNQYCSKQQLPFIHNGKIYSFRNLAKTQLDEIDIKTNEINSIFEDTTLLTSTNQYSQTINNINCIDNFIFLNSNEKIYYIDLKSTQKQISLLKETTCDSTTIYLNQKYLITEDSEYGEPHVTAITWLLAK